MSARTHHANGKHVGDRLDRLPPHNPAAEQAMLGSMLRDNSIIAAAIHLVRATDYYVFAHNILHRAIVELYAGGKAADIVTVAALLVERGQMDEIGGHAYLGDLWDAAPCAAHYRQYASIIKTQADHRSLMHLGREIEEHAADPGTDLAGIVAETESRLGEITRPSEALTPITMADLVEHYPEMRPAVIEGLGREGEVVNLIASPKFGKSWLALWMAFCVAMGRPWMGFPTMRGDVLLIDNELHKETLASRLRRVADAYGCFEEAKERIQILSLRGRLKDLHAIGGFLRTVKPGRFKLIVLDAFYRSIPKGTDENSNSDIAELYNLIDSYVDRLGCLFASIHHASKGNQATKGITDVGSGAGSQSRAADTHLILRPHQEENVVVMEAVVRSFPPVQPKCLRWEWPFFTVADGLDPADLAETTRRRKPKIDAESPGEAAKAKKRKEDEAKLLIALDKLDPLRTGANYSRVRDLAGLSGGAMPQATERLIADGIIEEIPFKSTIGKGGKKESRGLRRRDLGSSVNHPADEADG